MILTIVLSMIVTLVWIMTLLLTRLVMASFTTGRSYLVAWKEIKSKFMSEWSNQWTWFIDKLVQCPQVNSFLRLLLVCGWANASDAVEILCISFLLPSAECDLALTPARYFHISCFKVATRSSPSLIHKFFFIHLHPMFHCLF